MRIKAIPVEAVAAIKTHPALALAAVAVVGIGAYSYFRAPASSSGGTDASGQTMYGYSYASPLALGAANGTAGAVGGGIVDSMGNTQGALLDFEVLKESHDYALANRSLDLQTTVAGLNYDVSLKSIDASIYGYSAGIAQAFIRSGQQFVAGNIGGQTFAFLGSGTAPSGGKKLGTRLGVYSATQKWAANMFNQITQGLTPNVIQPSTGTLSTSPYGGARASNSLQPTGSNSITGFVSGNSSGGASPSTYYPSTITAANDGTSRSGSARLNTNGSVSL